MKPSSRARQWWKREKEIRARGGKLTAEDYELMSQLEVEDVREYVQIGDEESSSNQREMLLELANLQDGQEALTRFTKRFRSVTFLKDQRFFSPFILRDELRYLWAEPKLTAAAVRAAAWGWNLLPLKKEFKRAGNFVSMLFWDKPELNLKGGLIGSMEGWTPILPLGIIRPDDDNFIGQLGWAIAQNYSRFRLCKNPDCATPFYLWRRFDQQYCSSDGCVRYANRLAANRYWDAKGKQRRSLRKVVSS